MKLQDTIRGNRHYRQRHRGEDDSYYEPIRSGINPHAYNAKADWKGVVYGVILIGLFLYALYLIRTT
jgi:hypothetical protein